MPDISIDHSICSWPVADRPREKLFALGARQLSNSELLAILMGTGTRGQSALDLARKVLTKFKTFRAMNHSDSLEWREFSGLGCAKLSRILAALEIGRRFREDEAREARLSVKSSRDVVEILMPQMRDLKIEVFKAVYLNAKNAIIETVDISQGTVNRASPFIREIFQKALGLFAVSVICVHNHPSGDPAPSDEDRQFTRQLAQAGKVLEVKLLDHLIIGDNRYFSFRDAGQL